MLGVLEHLKESLSGSKIKWIEPYNLHITLFFLGGTDEKLIPLISERLKQLSLEFSSFRMEFEGVGVFKNFRDPRVIWIGIRDHFNICKLKSGIDDELGKFGFEAEKREFRPHLTIGRIKWIRKISVLEELVESYKNDEIQKTGIKEIIFYESILKPDGPLYLPLSVASLREQV